MANSPQDNRQIDKPNKLVDEAEIVDKTEIGRNRAARGIAKQEPLTIQARAIPPDQLDPQQFQSTEEGSGAFGRWTLQYDLPAYCYDMNQRRDTCAFYRNSEGLDRREHWHQVGNDHVTGIASNDGTFQVYLADRGGVFLNWWDPQQNKTIIARGGLLTVLLRVGVRIYSQLQYYMGRLLSRDQITPRGSNNKTDVKPPPGDIEQNEADASSHAYTGGFSYLKDDKEIWATAFRYAPDAAEFERYFGVGYVESVVKYRDIEVTRHIHAPYGDKPFFIADVEIKNLGDKDVTLQHYEYWDVNIHQLQVQWVRTGIAALPGDLLRSFINNRFFYSLKWSQEDQALCFTQTRDNSPRRSEEEQHEVDVRPPGVFLADLTNGSPTFFVNKCSFFGNGGPTRPDALQGSGMGLTSVPLEE